MLLVVMMKGPSTQGFMMLARVWPKPKVPCVPTHRDVEICMEPGFLQLDSTTTVLTDSSNRRLMTCAELPIALFVWFSLTSQLSGESRFKFLYKDYLNILYSRTYVTLLKILTNSWTLSLIKIHTRSPTFRAPSPPRNYGCSSWGPVFLSQNYQRIVMLNRVIVPSLPSLAELSPIAVCASSARNTIPNSEASCPTVKVVR